MTRFTSFGPFKYLFSPKEGRYIHQQRGDWPHRSGSVNRLLIESTRPGLRLLASILLFLSLPAHGETYLVRLRDQPAPPVIQRVMERHAGARSGALRRHMDARTSEQTPGLFTGGDVEQTIEKDLRRELEMSTSQVRVRLRDDVARLGGKVHRHFLIVNAAIVEMTPDTIGRLGDYVESAQLVTPGEMAEQNDFAPTWAQTVTNLPRLAPDGLSGYSTRIAVVDTGLNLDDLDFPGIRAAGSFSFLSAARRSDCATGPDSLRDLETNDDLNGHGTRMAKLAAGRTSGMARNAELIAVKIGYRSSCRNTTTWEIGDLLGAIEWLTLTYNSLPMVINLSLTLTPAGPDDLLSRIVDEIASTFDVIFTVAAGNTSGGRVEEVEPPGRGYNVITVGAWGPVGSSTPAGESDRSAHLWTGLSATGLASERKSLTTGQLEVVRRFKPDLVAPGFNVLVFGKDPENRTRSTGSSTATAITAGAAAIAHQYLMRVSPAFLDRGLRASAVKALLINSANTNDQFPLAQWDWRGGWGYLDLAPLALEGGGAAVVAGTIAGEGNRTGGSSKHVRIYRGRALRNVDGAWKATLTWPVKQGKPMADLNLYAYDQSGMELARSRSQFQNVEQVGGGLQDEIYLKVKAADARTGQSNEEPTPFALAIAGREFVETPLPEIRLSCTAAPARGAVGRPLPVRCEGSHTGDEAHRIRISIPTDFGRTKYVFADSISAYEDSVKPGGILKVQFLLKVNESCKPCTVTVEAEISHAGERVETTSELGIGVSSPEDQQLGVLNRPIPAHLANDVPHGTGISIGWWLDDQTYITAADVVSYRIYGGELNSLKLLQSLQRSEFGQTPLQLPALPPGKEYFWRVEAETASGVSAGPTWQFTTKRNIGLKGKPQLLSPAPNAKLSDTRPPFTWAAVPDAVSYRLIVRNGNGGIDGSIYTQEWIPGTLANPVGIPTTSLVPGRPYTWTAEAKFPDGSVTVSDTSAFAVACSAVRRQNGGLSWDDGNVWESERQGFPPLLISLPNEGTQGTFPIDLSGLRTTLGTGCPANSSIAHSDWLLVDAEFNGNNFVRGPRVGAARSPQNGVRVGFLKIGDSPAITAVQMQTTDAPFCSGEFELNLGNDALLVTNFAGVHNATLIVENPNCTPQFTVFHEWVTIGQVQKDSHDAAGLRWVVPLAFTKNPGSAPRRNILRAEMGSRWAALKIQQGTGDRCLLSITPTDLTTPQSATQTTVLVQYSITSGCPAKLNIASHSDWLRTGEPELKQNGSSRVLTVPIAAAENPDNFSRRGKIRIEGFEVGVTQAERPPL